MFVFRCQIPLLLLVVATTQTAWCSGGGLARVGDCSWPSPDDCEGSCTFTSEAPKGNSSKLLVSLSYLACGQVLVVSICWTRFVKHILATEPPSVGRHNGDQHASKHVNLERKIVCHSCDLLSSYCDWFIPLHDGIITLLTPLLSCELVVASSLVQLELRACIVA